MPFLLNITAELHALILVHKPRSMQEKEFPALMHRLHWDFLFLLHVLLMRKLARTETWRGHCYQQGDSATASSNHAEIPLESPRWSHPALLSKSFSICKGKPYNNMQSTSSFNLDFILFFFLERRDTQIGALMAWDRFFSQLTCSTNSTLSHHGQHSQHWDLKRNPHRG